MALELFSRFWAVSLPAFGVQVNPSCQRQVVDPYIEFEILLVFIDMQLMRAEAFLGPKAPFRI